MANIKERFEATGRNVPRKIVVDTFEALQHAVGVYIERQELLSDRVLVYNNEKLQAELVATLTNGQGKAAAHKIADELLENTWK